MNNIPFLKKNWSYNAHCGKWWKIKSWFTYRYAEKYEYIIKNNHLYKDNILRGTLKDKSQWIELFKKYFSFMEYEEFSLSESKKQYPRRIFGLRKNVIY